MESRPNQLHAKSPYRIARWPSFFTDNHVLLLHRTDHTERTPEEKVARERIRRLVETYGGTERCDVLGRANKGSESAQLVPDLIVLRVRFDVFDVVAAEADARLTILAFPPQ
jgi:hypothetical protein